MQHASGRISQPNLRLPTALLLQELAHTRECSTRTRSTGESVQGSSSLLPDLWARGFIVRPGVRNVIELVRPHGIGKLFGEFFRLVVVVFRVLVGYRGDWVDLGSEHFEEVDFFLTLTRGKRLGYSKTLGINGLTWVFGMKMMHRYPLALHTCASPIPVFPAVPSTTVPPGFNLSRLRRELIRSRRGGA